MSRFIFQSALVVCVLFAVPVYAADYDFEGRAVLRIASTGCGQPVGTALTARIRYQVPAASGPEVTMTYFEESPTNGAGPSAGGIKVEGYAYNPPTFSWVRSANTILLDGAFGRDEPLLVRFIYHSPAPTAITATTRFINAIIDSYRPSATCFSRYFFAATKVPRPN